MLIDIKAEIKNLLEEYDQNKGWRRWFSWFPWLGYHSDIRKLRDLFPQNDRQVDARFDSWGFLIEVLKRRERNASHLSTQLLTNLIKKLFAPLISVLKKDIYKEINDVNKDYPKIIESSSIDFLNSNPTQVVYVSTCKYFYNNIDTSDTVITKEIYEWKSNLNEFKIKSREVL